MTHQLHSISSISTKTARKRVGRGNASGRGNTSGRGTKGQKSRTGKKLSAKFEGGQMPLVQRIAKRKGFRSHRKFSTFRLNLKDLSRYAKDGQLTIVGLREAGLIDAKTRVKLLGEGEAPSGLTVQVHETSASAQEKLTAAGSKIEIV